MTINQITRHLLETRKISAGNAHLAAMDLAAYHIAIQMRNDYDIGDWYELVRKGLPPMSREDAEEAVEELSIRGVESLIDELFGPDF